jgi:lipopolysaccharide transport protein LptA
MKPICILLLLGLAVPMIAQTNSTPPESNSIAAADEPSSPSLTNAVATALSTAERAVTEIFSDSANFDLKNHLAVYIGHVRVVDAQMKMTCGMMTASVPQSGKIDRIVAQQNVTIDALDNEGKPVHATAEKAVYLFHVIDSVTNETIELSGNPRPHVEKEDGVLTGDTITWDRANNNFGASGNQHMIIRQQINQHREPPAAKADGK